MAKLANCPVCGVEPETRMDDEFGFPLYSVGCECCTMGTGYLQKKSDARKLWNEHAERAPVWISVKDRLPEAWQTVLLWDGSEMVSGYADDDNDLIEHK